MSGKKRVTKILLAEGNLADAFLFQTVLGSGDFSLDIATTLEETVKLALANDYDLALLNLTLSDSSGLDTLAELIRCVEKLPVVALTGIDDIESGPLAIRIGAQDFLAKTDATRSLLRLPDVIGNAIERKRVLDTLVGPGQRNSLTGLMETGAAIDWIDHLLSRKGDPPSFAVVAMELPGLLQVKEELGDEAAGVALIALTQRLEKQIRGYDTPALIGPEELVVILERIQSVENLNAIAERLGKAIAAPLKIHGVEFPLKVFCATIYCQARSTDPQELLEVVCRAARLSMDVDCEAISGQDASTIPPWNTGE